MGQQLSKTSIDQLSTDHSSTLSASSSEFSQLDPITCSPSKMKLISKQIKIRTTCFLKTTPKTMMKTANIQETHEIQPLTQVLSKIHSSFRAHSSPQEHQEFEKLIPSDQNQKTPTNCDIDRIDSLFEFLEQNLNMNQFEADNPQKDKNILLNKWKTSVNTIMVRLQSYFTYCQGQLLICAIMRLHLDQDTTYLFLSLLLQKVGHLLSCPYQLLSFGQRLNNNCETMFPKLKKALELNDLDFQVVYLNWIMGMFSTSFSQETCMRIWYKLCISQNPTQILQSVILSCMNCIEKHLNDHQFTITNPQQDEIQLTNRFLSTLIDETKIHALIK